MKKLFTLVALLACFLGAKAEWVDVYSIDYSTKTAFPFYVMGYVPEWVDGVMTDYGADYRYATQADLDGDGDAKWKDGESSVGEVTIGNTVYQKVTGAGPYWHQYIIAADVPMELDGNYVVKAMVKSSAAVQANLQFGNWGSLKETGVTIPQSDSFQEVEWEVNGCLYAGNGFICIQPGTSTATIEWKSLTVSQNKKQEKPVEWIEDLTNGDASKTWAEMGLADVKYNDQDNNFKVCAWGKERLRNMNENDGWDPFPADIEQVDGNNAFVVHGKPAITEGDASQWDNQFWMQSPKSWKSGTQIKVHFRYKASQDNVKTNTQIHKQNPSDYLIWHAIGDVTFSTTWQEFDGVMTIQDDMAGGWSIAFNLNAEVKDAVDFYFDDLSWQHMKLDEGYFVAGANTNKGIEYDLANAIEFKEENGNLVATVGDKNAWVNQIMISTVRGNDAAFKGATLKPSGTIVDDPTEWLDYTESSLAKLNLPGEGIWKVFLDPEYKSMAFQMLEGKKIEPIEINPNPIQITVHGKERDWRGKDNDGNLIEEQEGTGQPWDNQFWIIANRVLEAGEETVVQFKYKASKEAKVSTQCHATPGNYIHWGAIGDVNFTTDWQEFSADFTIPNECAGKNMQSIAFNMAEIKEACDYELKDFVWKLKDNTESLIWQDAEAGKSNFYIKEGAGTEPYILGITNVTSNNKTSAVIYNLSGQRVSKDYKGIVVTNGRKYIAK